MVGWNQWHGLVNAHRHTVIPIKERRMAVGLSIKQQRWHHINVQQQQWVNNNTLTTMNVTR